MCGIVGWANLNSNSSPNEADEMLLRAMCAKIKHRGPDSEGVFLSESVALGMRRLSVIDLYTGAQPVFNEDRAISVVMNGEIYNFQELQKDLEQRGHKFFTHTDTEVLPHLYEEHGVLMVEKLNGMFAFALWDSRRKKLFMARDRFGEKPLYYGVFAGKLFFASELKALLAHADVETRINFQALRQYLAFDYVPAPLSIYQGIFKLPAAHSLTLENGEIRIERYWNLSFQKRQPTPSVEEAAEELRALLADATKMRFMSDVPLGVLLSGGVDSSSIAAFAQQFSSQPVKTFSIGFDEASFDESHFARQVATHLGTEHYEDILSVDKAADLLPEIATWLDEPLADASILPTFLLSRFARSEVTVALGGDGGDEIFAGYPWYYAHKMAERYEKIPRFLRQNFFESIVNNLPTGTKNMPFDFMAKRFIKALANQDLVARHHSFFGSFTISEQENLLTDAVKSQNGADIYGEARRWLKTWDSDNLIDSGNAIDSDNVIERMLFLDMKFYLAENILTKIDRASMAVSLEVRSPFLDPRIAEFSASLPRDYKLNCNSAKFAFGNTGKFILKKAVAPLLPDSVTKRRKKGFVIPVAAWLKGKLNPLACDLLAPERIKKQGLFNPTFVNKLLTEHETGKANHFKTLWTLLIFQLWSDNFSPKD
ncbi:MAG: asparagine synthase (glutamine-hydrolyzing) [Acidobacteria bacterium]|jgi:asparagine synthase (glutamine-hydrolysing)|nr:asparagine synthase (glutamine-hydrolyzing) [Acidobacteriota bacterium]